MNTLRQTGELMAIVARAFYRDPGAVIAMVAHHWFGDPERAAELAKRVTTAGKRIDNEPHHDEDT